MTDAPVPADTEKPAASAFTRQRAFIAVGVLLVAALAGYFGWHWLSPREDTDEPPQDQLKASLLFLRGQFGYRWLFAKDVLQFRD